MVFVVALWSGKVAFDLSPTESLVLLVYIEWLYSWNDR